MLQSIRNTANTDENVQSAPQLWQRLREHLGVIVLCGIFLVVGRLHLNAIAPFEGPDELEHLSYVLKLRQTGQLPYPPLDVETTPIQQQVGQPPLYYLAAAVYSLPHTTNGLNTEKENIATNPWYGFPDAPYSNDNRNWVMMNPAVHILTSEQLALSEFMMWTRGVSALFGVVAVIGVYWGGLALWQGEKGSALLATALFTFTPSIIQSFSTVTNDAAVLAFGTLTLAGALHLYQRPTDRRLLMLTGLFMAGAALSKVSGITLYPIPVAAVILGSWRDRIAVQQSVKALVIMFIVPALLAGWWFLRALILFDDPLGTQPHLMMWWSYNEPLPIEEALARLPIILQTLWFYVGWSEVRPPVWMHMLLLTLIGLGVSGGLIALILRPKRRRRKFDPRLLLLVLTLVIGLVGVIRWMQMFDYSTGRLYLPYYAALILLIVWGLRQLPRVLHYLSGGAWIAAAMIVVPLTLQNAFGAPQLLDTVPNDLQGSPIEFDLVRFVGYRMESPTIREDAWHKVSLCWQAAQNTDGSKIPVPYPFALHIIIPPDWDQLQPRPQIIGRRESYLGLGTYTLMEPGKAFCDTFDLPITGALEPGREYPIYLTLYDVKTGSSLPGYVGDTDTPSSKIIGYVRAEG